MSLALGRATRTTAGNRMSKLLNAEEEDDFYKTTYGGFNDESGDDEYKCDLTDTEDEVDSDFDIDEGDEPSSEQEDDCPQRKSRVVTKAYKEPIKVAKPKLKPKKQAEPPKKPVKDKADKRKVCNLQEDPTKNRKSVRQSTTEHTRLTYLRLQERQVAPRRRKGARHERPMTQEELLAEAKITAEINLRSLENYERLEADKKKQVHKRHQCKGVIIRYHSMLMPLTAHPPLKEESVDVEGLDQQEPYSSAPLPNTCDIPLQPLGSKCSRTFITFGDDATYESCFPQSTRPQIPIKEVCPVTHKPALYRDPITDIPYANVPAFKIIREAYNKYVMARGLPSPDPSVSSTSSITSGYSTAVPETFPKGLRQRLTLKPATSSS